MEALDTTLNMVITGFSIVLAVVTSLLSFYAFRVRRRADMHLAELLKKELTDSNQSFSEQELKQLRAVEEFMRSNADGLTTVQKDILEQQIISLRLESLRRKVLKLSERLNKSDREKILDTLNQSSERGKMNYLNSILEQSENIKGVRYS